MAETTSDNERARAGTFAASKQRAPFRLTTLATMALGATLYGVFHNADRRIRWMNAFRDLVTGDSSSQQK